MSLRYVFFREHPNTHDEVYATRTGEMTFGEVPNVGQSNLVFDTAAEAYFFGSYFPKLQNWRVGSR